VVSSEIQIHGTWGGEPASRRINCGTDSLGQQLADVGTTKLTISAKITSSATGSLVALNTSGSNPLAKRANGDRLPACVLTTDFVTRLLDDIQQKAQGAPPSDTTRPSNQPAAPAPQPAAPAAQPADTSVKPPRDTTQP
jgi:hypothetical protein